MSERGGIAWVDDPYPGQELTAELSAAVDMSETTAPGPAGDLRVLQYRPKGTDDRSATSPDAAPNRAEDLSGLPPAFVHPRPQPEAARLCLAAMAAAIG